MEKKEISRQIKAPPPLTKQQSKRLAEAKRNAAYSRKCIVTPDAIPPELITDEKSVPLPFDSEFLASILPQPLVNIITKYLGPYGPRGHVLHKQIRSTNIPATCLRGQRHQYISHEGLGSLRIMWYRLKERRCMRCNGFIDYRGDLINLSWNMVPSDYYYLQKPDMGCPHYRRAIARFDNYDKERTGRKPASYLEFYI